MCGIAGIFYRDRTQTVESSLLRAMGNSIAHRGPDGEGYLRAPGIGLAHRRLSIIDLDGGAQPMANEDDSIHVIFNGEIYNHLEIRSNLEARGHRFRSRSDTEVLVHLYEEEGDRLCNRLRGMFAFAIWDKNKGRLLLARDRLGIKPLYTYRDVAKLVFGSELKAILSHPGIPRELDLCGLEDFLAFGMIPGSRSIFKNFAKLPAAHTLTLSENTWDAAPRRYWNLEFRANHTLSAVQWQEAVQAKVNEAVGIHLMSDVPIGAFLSGGVDSSVVVGSAARQNSGELRTFSIGFKEERFSELPFAREVARCFDTTHHEDIVTPDAVDLLSELTHFYDEPFADSSAIPTFLVARLASQSVKVVLSGDGGDEAFGGYARYGHDLREAAIRSALPIWLRRGILGPLGRWWPKADWLPRVLRVKTLLTNVALEPGSAYANSVSMCRMPLRRQLLANDLLKSLNGYQPEQVVSRAFERVGSEDILGGMIAADTATLLTDDFLVKVDRASMAHGLEVRPPLLDHEVLEMAACIPSKWKVHHGETKWILKRAFEEKLPAGVVTRPKQGFEIPIDQWLKKPLRPLFEAAVLDAGAPVGPLLNQAAVQKLYRAHCSGIGRHGPVLWSLLVLAHWADRYLRTTMPELRRLSVEDGAGIPLTA